MSGEGAEIDKGLLPGRKIGYTAPNTSVRKDPIMIFSNTTEYAIRGLAELACRSTGGTILLDQLVAGTNLPRDFLAKIFQRLVRAKLLTSAKGRGGGFALARPAHQITLLHIVEAIEG